MMKGAIFDMDGVLVDSEPLYQANWTQLAEAFGQTPNPNFPVAVGGTNGEEMRQVIRNFYPSVDPYAFQKACIARVGQIIDEQGVPLKAGVRELLQFFRARGIKIAVASSAARERILKNLQKTEILDAFDTVVSSLEVAHGKPEPDIFLAAARQLSLAPEECYVFEDSINGVRAGMAAGCAVVMVPDLAPPPDELNVYKVCSSLCEVRTLIEQGII